MSWFGRSTSPEKQAVEDQGAYLQRVRERRKKAMARLMTALGEIPVEVPEETPGEDPSKTYDQKPLNGYKNGHD